MGLAKKEIFTAEQNRIADLAKVMGHPARVAILEHLLQINNCVCGDLVGEIGLAQSTISQHLKELKKLGLINGTIQGTSVCYCVDMKAWKSMKNLLNEFLNKDLTVERCC